MGIDLRANLAVEHDHEFFKGLGSFWTEKYEDKAVIQALADAAQDAQVQATLNLQEAVLVATDLANAPIYHTQLWYRVLLLESQMGQDHPLTPAYGSPEAGIYGASLVYGQRVPTLWTFPTSVDLVNPRCCANRITDASFIGYRNQAFYYRKGVIGFRFDPFSTEGFPVVETESGRGVYCWFYLSDWDFQLVQNQYAAGLGINGQTSEHYRRLIQGAWSGRVKGPNDTALYQVVSGATGVELCHSNGETVEWTGTQGTAKVVVTDKRAYRFPSTHTVTVALGDTLVEGQAMTDGLKVVSSASLKSGQDPIALPPGFFNHEAGVQDYIQFPNAKVNVADGGLDPQGNRVTKFLLHGKNDDVERYRGYAATKGLYRALDVRGLNAVSVPTAAQLKTKVNPAVDLVAKHCLPHLVLLYGDPAKWPASPELQAQLQRQADKLLPPHARLVIQPPSGFAMTVDGLLSESFSSQTNSSSSSSSPSRSLSSRSTASSLTSASTSRSISTPSSLSSASSARSDVSTSSSSKSTATASTQSGSSASSVSTQSLSSRSSQSPSSNSSNSLSSRSSQSLSTASTNSSSSQSSSSQSQSFSSRSNSSNSTNSSSGSSSTMRQRSTSSRSATESTASTVSSASSNSSSSSSSRSLSSQSLSSQSSNSSSSNSSSSKTTATDSSRSSATNSTISSRSESSFSQTQSSASSQTSRSDSSRSSRTDSSRSEQSLSTQSLSSLSSRSSASEYTAPIPSQSSQSSNSSSSSSADDRCGAQLLPYSSSGRSWTTFAFLNPVDNRRYVVNRYVNGHTASVNLQFYAFYFNSGANTYAEYAGFLTNPCGSISTATPTTGWTLANGAFPTLAIPAGATAYIALRLPVGLNPGADTFQLYINSDGGNTDSSASSVASPSSLSSLSIRSLGTQSASTNSPSSQSSRSTRSTNSSSSPSRSEPGPAVTSSSSSSRSTASSKQTRSSDSSRSGL